jgi:hypothetical protein
LNQTAPRDEVIAALTRPPHAVHHRHGAVALDRSVPPLALGSERIRPAENSIAGLDLHRPQFCWNFSEFSQKIHERST